MKKNYIKEILLYIFKITILIIIYNFLIGTSIVNILKCNLYSLLTFLVIFILYSQLHIPTQIINSKLQQFIIQPILLLIGTLILVPVPQLLHKQKINTEYAALEKEINDFIKKSDEIIKYKDYNESMEEDGLSIIDNHTIYTIFLDYDNKEIAVWSGIYTFERYVLSKKDNCATQDDEYFKEYKIQYKKSLSSPGNQLITYYYFGPENTHKIELIMDNGTHYYGCPSNHHTYTRLNEAINNEK